MNKTTHSYEGLDIWEAGDACRDLKAKRQKLLTELERVREKSTSIAVQYNFEGIGSPTDHTSRQERSAVTMYDIECVIKDLDLQIIRLEKIITRYLMKIPDAGMRVLIDYRYIFNMSWDEIAAEMKGCARGRAGGYALSHPNAESYKKSFHRYRDKQRKAGQPC